MDKPGGPRAKRGFGFFRNRTYLFWIPLGIVGAGALPAILFWGLEREDPVWGIPSRALFKIQQEKAQAQKDHDEFLKTPAGRKGVKKLGICPLTLPSPARGEVKHIEIKKKFHPP